MISLARFLDKKCIFVMRTVINICAHLSELNFWITIGHYRRKPCAVKNAS